MAAGRAAPARTSRSPGSCATHPSTTPTRAVWAAQVACMRAAVALDRRPRRCRGLQRVLRRQLAPGSTPTTFRSIRSARFPCPVPSAVPIWPSPGTCSTRARAGLTTRIVVVGAESTGTTTVVGLLAEHYRARGGRVGRTPCVGEYGRDYTIIKWERHAPRPRQRASRSRRWTRSSGPRRLRRGRRRADPAGERGRRARLAAAHLRHRRLRHLRLGAPLPRCRVPAAPAVGTAPCRAMSTCSPRTRACRGTTTACAKATWRFGRR